MNFKNKISSDIVIQKAIQTASEIKTEVYLVGGYVRDIILRRNSKDIDFVISGDGVSFAKELIERLPVKVKLTVFKTFGTASFTYNGIGYEFVGARKESYRKESRNPEVQPATIEEDRARRDFTINTLSISLNQNDLGDLQDPYNGLVDIKERIIRTPVDPFVTFFDDPLRMMRAVRFATQHNFTIEAKCLRAINELSERITIITSERVSDELNKILLSPKPSLGFYLLDKTGLLRFILPEVNKLKGVEKNEKYAHKDVFIHTLEVLDNIAEKSDNLWLRWSALLHDIGKPLTKKFVQGTGFTFHGHEVVGVRITKKIFARLKLPQHVVVDYVCKLVALHLRPIALVEDDVTDSAIRRLLYDAGDEIDELMLLCEADITSKNENKIKLFLENFKKVREKLIEVESKDKLRNWQPPISGELIMSTFGLTPSKEVGLIKNAIREAILDGEIENNYDDAYRFMVIFAEKLNIYPLL